MGGEDSEVTTVRAFTTYTSANHPPDAPGVVSELESFLCDEAAELFAAVAGEQTPGGEIELGPPEFTRDEESGTWTFEPKGWVGQYPEKFSVEQQRVDTDVFSSMQTEVAEWIETAGPAVAKSILRFVPDVALSTANIYRSYSRQLIEQTEAVLAHRPPVDTKFVRETGLAPRGRPLPAQTAQHRARGQPHTVAQRVEFTLDTLPNLLLIRFHLAMAGALADLRRSLPAGTDRFAESISYHRDFVGDQFPAELSDKALERDFDSPDIIAQARAAADEKMARVIDLWEGFRNQTPLAISLAERLDTSIQPAEKIYELYVLNRLLEALTQTIGTDAVIGPDGLDEPIAIGPFLLRYDLEYGASRSRLLSDAFGLDSINYRPDYVLEHEDAGPIWVGDAKFKWRLERADGERFIRYLIDLLPAGRDEPATGTLFTPGIARQHTTEARDYRIETVKVSPRQETNPFDLVQQTVQQY